MTQSAPKMIPMLRDLCARGCQVLERHPVWYSPVFDIVEIKCPPSVGETCARLFFDSETEQFAFAYLDEGLSAVTTEEALSRALGVHGEP